MRERIKLINAKASKIMTKAPELFSASGGDIKGDIDLQWDPIEEASFYIIQICLYSQKNLKWIQIDIITRSSYTISGLQSGRKYCFRISAVNASGRGPWSKVIEKNVP